MGTKTKKVIVAAAFSGLIGYALVNAAVQNERKEHLREVYESYKYSVQNDGGELYIGKMLGGSTPKDPLRYELVGEIAGKNILSRSIEYIRSGKGDKQAEQIAKREGLLIRKDTK